MTVAGFNIGIQAESHQETHMGFSPVANRPKRPGIISGDCGSEGARRITGEFQTQSRVSQSMLFDKKFTKASMEINDFRLLG